MNIITDKAKTPAKLRYRVSNNSGTINKEFGKNQQADRHRRRELFINLKIKRHGKYIQVVSY